jgi:hypothetical protein
MVILLKMKISLVSILSMVLLIGSTTAFPFLDWFTQVQKRDGCGNADVNALYAYLSAQHSTSFCSSYLGYSKKTTTGE